MDSLVSLEDFILIHILFLIITCDLMIIYELFFFFFQAEDGIRDKLLTGVQTCALPIFTRSDLVDDSFRVGAELGVVVAFGRLIKPHVLDVLPMVNVHFSLLPRWRGAAPVERAILAGDRETGVCLMGLEEGLDTGPIYDGVRLDIGPEETADELRARLVSTGTDLLVQSLERGLAEPVPQTGEATYAAKIEPGELHLEWERPAVEVHRGSRPGRA